MSVSYFHLNKDFSLQGYHFSSFLIYLLWHRDYFPFLHISSSFPGRQGFQGFGVICSLEISLLSIGIFFANDVMLMLFCLLDRFLRHPPCCSCLMSFVDNDIHDIFCQMSFVTCSFVYYLSLVYILSDCSLSALSTVHFVSIIMCCNSLTIFYIKQKYF